MLSRFKNAMNRRLLTTFFFGLVSVVILGNVSFSNWGFAPKGGFRSDVDVIQDYLGSVKHSHPEEFAASLKRLEDAGVDVRFVPGEMRYSPELGRPGRLYLDPDGSIGALRHEVRHFDDIAAEGYQSLGYYLQRPKEFWRMEFRGYLEEFEIARVLRNEEAVSRILDQMRKRKAEIFGQ